MGENSKIEWCDHTFNPWRGCKKVAAGCANCYAESMSRRNPGTLGIWGPNGTRVVASEAMWKQPEQWDKDAAVWPLHLALCEVSKIPNPIIAWEERDGGKLPDPAIMKRPRVFCASFADVFEEWPGAMFDSKRHPLRKRHDGSWIIDGSGGILRNDFPLSIHDVRNRLFGLIDKTPYLDWLLLTKRPQNIRRMVPAPPWSQCRDGSGHVSHDLIGNKCQRCDGNYRKNVWLGTSIACKADLPDIEHLRECRDLAPVRFLSIEPLIDDLGEIDLTDINWVIVGGESGHNARPVHPDWVRSIRYQCHAAKVPFFFKQWGEFLHYGNAATKVQREAISNLEGSGNHSPSYVFRTQDGQPYGMPMTLAKVGKETAGRFLDGREWNEFPEVAK